jgi:hypothetical protein
MTQSVIMLATQVSCRHFAHERQAATSTCSTADQSEQPRAVLSMLCDDPDPVMRSAHLLGLRSSGKHKPVLGAGRQQHHNTLDLPLCHLMIVQLSIESARIMDRAWLVRVASDC